MKREPGSITAPREERTIDRGPLRWHTSGFILIHMTNTNSKSLPAELHNAHDWIASAGEWTAALESPASYADAAEANAREHGADVSASDLLEAIEWERFARLTPAQLDAYNEYAAECSEAGTAPNLVSFVRGMS